MLTDYFNEKLLKRSVTILDYRVKSYPNSKRKKKVTILELLELKEAGVQVIVTSDLDISAGALKEGDLVFFSHIKKILGNFDVSNNRLKTLNGCPQEVGKSFYIYENILANLEGGPSKVGVSYLCSHNRLVSLRGAPSVILGHFNCRNNLLTNLIGGPVKVGQFYYCANNYLQSIDGAPLEVKHWAGDGMFDLSDVKRRAQSEVKRLAILATLERLSLTRCRSSVESDCVWG